MSEQLAFEFAARRRTDGLFFAIFPPPSAAARMHRIGLQQRAEHALKGRVLPVGRLHVSLLGFGEHAGLPQALATKAIETAAGVAMTPFDVAFDRVMSFAGRQLPLVLCGRDGLAELTAFQRLLGGAMQRAGLGRAKPQYTPHVTLLYDERCIEEQAIDPIGWTAREFVLVHSLLGRTQYIPLGCWPLRV